MDGHRKVWKVVGGLDKGGILVRMGCDLNSAQTPDRLSTEAFVLQLELIGDRLRYEKLTGLGPSAGWVSVRLSGKSLMVQVEEEAEHVMLDKDDLSSCMLMPLTLFDLRICTWNLLAPCYHRGSDGKNEIQTKCWKSRVEKQVHTIMLVTDPDVLCLQEVWFSPTVIHLIEDFAAKRGYQVVMCRRTGEKMDGLAILVRSSRFEVVASESQEICEMGNRVALWLLLRPVLATGRNAQPLVVGTTHFTFPHGDQQDYQRLRQSTKANLACCDFAMKHGLDPESAVLILAGDLNCESGPVGDEALDIFLGDNWRSAFAEANGKEAMATHRAHNQNHACADFILAHGMARTVSAKLLPTTDADTATIPRPLIGGAEGFAAPRTLYDWSQLSDHRPLVATLDLRPADDGNRPELGA